MMLIGTAVFEHENEQMSFNIPAEHFPGPKRRESGRVIALDHAFQAQPAYPSSAKIYPLAVPGLPELKKDSITIGIGRIT